MRGGYSEIITDGRNRVNTYFLQFYFDIAEVCVKEMKSDATFFRKFANTLLDGFFGAFEIIVIEIESDKNISLVEFLDDTYCMTPKSEGAVNHNIPSSRAQIEAVYILMEEYRDMSKTFFVQIVKK